MDHARKTELIVTYRDGLLKDTLPFWTKHCVDLEHDGFMMSLDRDGTVVEMDKGVWQQGRLTWLLSELYKNVEPGMSGLNWRSAVRRSLISTASIPQTVECGSR